MYNFNMQKKKEKKRKYKNLKGKLVNTYMDILTNKNIC